MTSRRRRSPRNRSDIADFVRQRVRDALDGDRDDVNIARAVNVAKPGSTTAVSSTQYVEIIERQDRRQGAKRG